MESIADRTVVMRMPPPPEGEYYKRANVVEFVTNTVGRSGVSAIGQLESVGSWEVVFHSTSLKCRFLEAMRGAKVDGKEVHTYPLKSSLRWVRITRIPYCVPHEVLVAEIYKFGGKVVHHEFEVDPNDDLMTNVRSYKVEVEDDDSLPDRIEWRFEGLRGTGLLFVRGRKPRCDACGSREHFSKDCSTPYCRRCRQSGHFQSDSCGRRSYASVMVGAIRDSQQQPTGSAAAPPTGPTAAAPTPPPTAVPEATATVSLPEPTDAEPTPQPATQPTEQPEPEPPTLQPVTPMEPVEPGVWSEQTQEVQMSETLFVAEEVALPRPPATKDRARPLESASEAGSDADDQSGDRMDIGEIDMQKRNPKKSRTADTNDAKPPTPKAATPGRRRSVAVPDPTAGRSNSRTPVTATRRHT
jgi:hypothetical protein